MCDALKGRLRYFITKYKKSPDQLGRIAIIVDGREIIQGRIFNFYKGYNEVEKYIEECRLKEEMFNVWQFTDAVKIFLSSSIEESINSENLLIRLLVIVDRRIGKRTLIKFKKSISQQPDWLQYFYKLRFEAEGINV